jgi:hypothetical protein
MPYPSSRLRQGPIGPESRSRAFLAVLITCLLVVMVPLMVALIGYRSIMLHGPTTAVVIAGDSTIDGAKIQVTEAIEPHRKWLATLERSNEWQAPVLLDPGAYHVVVTHRGNLILDEKCTPDRLNGVRFELKSMVWIIGNSSLADAKIDIVYVGDNSQIPGQTAVTLSAAAHYRQPVYLYAGEYRAIARSRAVPDRILAQTNFAVNRVTPTQVDLTKVPAGDE